jgi:hypothetical protein
MGSCAGHYNARALVLIGAWMLLLPNFFWRVVCLSLQRHLDSTDFILHNIKSYRVVWTVLGPLYIPRNFSVQNTTKLITLIGLVTYYVETAF